jgi:hypothetical protein
VQYAKARGYRGIIAGHTHFCDDQWIDGIHYLNSGCWVDPSCTYVRVEGDQAKLHHWLEAPAAPELEPKGALEIPGLNGYVRLPPLTWQVPRHNGVVRQASAPDHQGNTA